MRGVLVFFTLVVVGTVLAAVSTGIYYYFRRKRDNRTPPRDSHYPSSSFNSGATWTQTQQVYTPPPPPVSYTPSSYRPPATYAYSQTTPKATAPPSPDYGRGSYHSSVASPPARKPSKPRLPSTRTQPSPTLTQPSATRTQPPLTRTQPSVTHTQPSFTHTQPSLHVPPRETTESEPRLPAAPTIPSPRPHPDEPATVEGLDVAEKLREQARRRSMEMTEAYSRAKLAQKKGSRGAAQEHKRRGHAHKSAMKELDKRAAEIIFREKNKNRKEGMIDLHSLHVAEAIRIAKDQVQAARLRGDKVVHFIVGQGLHANDGVAKIRPALQVLFTKQGLTHSLDPKNSGKIIIQL